MGESIIRERVIEEIKLIPEHKLLEIYDFLHYFRIGLQKSIENIDQIMSFAGCWEDMPEEVFSDFLEEIAQRRTQAFLRRRSSETGTD